RAIANQPASSGEVQRIGNKIALYHSNGGGGGRNFRGDTNSATLLDEPARNSIFNDRGAAKASQQTNRRESRRGENVAQGKGWGGTRPTSSANCQTFPILKFSKNVAGVAAGKYRYFESNK
ncbi:MAG: hypothetical protein WBD19_21205, partial [Candidatus Acidiferrum sp.]